MYKNLVRPGFFQEPVACDMERMCFDEHNDAVLTLGVHPDFVFIGDSITQFWALDLYFDRSKVILNRGIGGDVPKYILKRFDADVLQLHPDYCVFMAGTNYANEMMDNIWTGAKGKSFEEVTEKTIHDIKAVIDYSLEHEQKIIVGTIPPAIVPPADRRNEMIPIVNRSIKDHCSEKGVIVADYYEALVDSGSGQMRPEYTTDGIHPHAVGFQKMAETLRSELALHGITI